MNYKKYPNEDIVNFQIGEKEKLTIAVPFDENMPVLMSSCGEDHSELFSHYGNSADLQNKYFCIYAYGETALWFCECPPDYKGISDRKSRAAQFYCDGCTAISRVLSHIGYFSDLKIPNKYRKMLSCDS